MKVPARPIRQKIGILLLIVTLAYTAINHAVDRMTLHPRFLELERQQTLLDLKRCEEAIRREAHHLGVLAGDWAAWDDTYHFVHNVDEVYIDANLATLTFYDNHLDLIALFDEERNLVWGQAHDAVDQHTLPLRDLIEVPLPLSLHCPDPGITHRGLINTQHGTMVVASQPILQSNNEGPVRGTFVMGRLLCEPVMQALREQTGIPFTVTMAREFDEEAARIFTLIREGAGVHLDLEHPGMLEAYSEMPDISGNPAVVVSFSAPRVFMEKEREVLRSAFLGTLIGGLLILLCLLILLSTAVIRPMQSLAAQVTAIGASADRSARLAVDREDEIGMVSDEFNALLARIEDDFNSLEATTTALAASETRLATLLDADPNAVLMLDTRGCIERANPASKELFGLSPDSLHGRRLCSLLPDPSFDSIAVWNRVAEGVDAFRGEVEATRADGTTFPAYIVLRVFQLEGEIHRVAVVTDLSEFKRMHAAVLRAQHLASLGELGATVAHELRNPVAGISNAVEILRDTMPADDPRRDTLEEMQRQAHRVERTVQSLLDFARPWKVVPESVPLLPFALETWQRLHADIGGAEVTLTCDGDESMMATADRGLMEQVFRNLYENAIQSMGGSGRIQITATGNGSRAILRIADEGGGIPAGMRDRVFEPFFTTRTTGVGLGLAVCRTLVEAQGGHISIGGEAGGGAVVRIELPKGENTE